MRLGRSVFSHPYTSFYHLLVNGFSVIIIISIFIIIIINIFRRVFSEYTEAVTTSLIPIDAIPPEICAFIVGFSCTVWTIMRSLQAYWLADSVLADAVLILPHPPTPPTAIMKARGLRKSTETSTRKTIY